MSVSVSLRLRLFLSVCLRPLLVYVDAILYGVTVPLAMHHSVKKDAEKNTQLKGVNTTVAINLRGA